MLLGADRLVFAADGVTLYPQCPRPARISETGRSVSEDDGFEGFNEFAREGEGTAWPEIRRGNPFLQGVDEQCEGGRGHPADVFRHRPTHGERHQSPFRIAGS
ncbi:hypothetical protein D3C87_1764460 [compost metagenome]